MNLGANIRIAQCVGIARRSTDRHGVAEPLVGKSSQPIFIGNTRRIRSEYLVFGHETGNGRHTDRQVIHIRNRADASTAQTFVGAAQIKITGNDRDGGADIGLDQGYRWYRFPRQYPRHRVATGK